jgi:putative ABC transport system permease protein
MRRGTRRGQQTLPRCGRHRKDIRAGQLQYTIVGITKAQGSVFGQSKDHFVMIPLGTYRKEWLTLFSSVTMFIQARDPGAMDAAEDEARVILRSRRHQAYDADDSFAIIAPTAIMGLWNRITGNAFAIAIWITSVFLVVGGIVIMNIMLASVTERTREIGLRKSLGARRTHIVTQFLVESCVMSILGGFLGRHCCRGHHPIGPRRYPHADFHSHHCGGHRSGPFI